MLKWQLSQLDKYYDRPLTFDETVSVKSDLMQRDDEILDATPVHVTGQIQQENGDWVATVRIQGQLTVPSTRSLKPVELPVDEQFSEIYADPETASLDRYEDTDVVIPLKEHALDLMPAVEDHLLLSVPLRVLSTDEQQSDAMPKGNDWEVISESEYAKRQQESRRENSQFAKLKDLLPDDDNGQDDSQK
ncbi:metal-binding protein [Lactobacillus selangorensis]|uniref:Metal-binding protein n=1 Tax=Lactobacillus selangorensis TaxID=81857 RepID=A0A0R2FMA1_9LACO|nr:YceD family protein [Lactobacillus selangorensis]KRN29727.1 metal-binding protein [Lactobacillus selangorensis]KRN33744.1 metal-binding protein [Lactobacillus selangorensis]